MRTQARRIAGALTPPGAFSDLLDEAKTESAKLLARWLIYGGDSLTRANFDAAARAGEAELAERASAQGLSRNEIAQIRAIFREKVERRVAGA